MIIKKIQANTTLTTVYLINEYRYMLLLLLIDINLTIDEPNPKEEKLEKIIKSVRKYL